MQNKPTQLNDPDLTELRSVCQQYIDFIYDNKEYNVDRKSDYEGWIVDVVLEAIFGKDVWDKYINPILDTRER
jgi:hypothetical protein